MKYIALYDDGSPYERDFHFLADLDAVIAHKEIHCYGYWAYYFLGDEL